MRSWDKLPAYMRTEAVRPYWESLKRKRGQLFVKRLFDIYAAWSLLVFFAVPMLVIAVWIILDSPGGAVYCQERVTQYGRRFRIHKFRTMYRGADAEGALLTVQNDCRITRAGKILRKYRLDELPQLFDVAAGNMSFVGTRPEAVKYVKAYRPEYFATLLLPAGITSETSIQYLSEGELLKGAEDPDRMYLEKILPEKMALNLRSVREFSLAGDIVTMVRTAAAVFGTSCRE